MDNAPAFLFVDELENVCADRANPKTEAHEKRLTNAFLEAWNTVKESGKNVVFIGETNHPELLDINVLKKTTKIKTSLPCREERKAYFERKLKKLIPEKGMTIEEMVEKTENYSYRSLEAFEESCKE